MTFSKKSNVFEVLKINYKITKFFGLFLYTIENNDLLLSKTTYLDYAGFTFYFSLYFFFEIYNFSLTTYLESTDSDITKIGF